MMQQNCMWLSLGKVGMHIMIKPWSCHKIYEGPRRWPEGGGAWESNKILSQETDLCLMIKTPTKNLWKKVMENTNRIEMILTKLRSQQKKNEIKLTLG
jgi:hypothetical protein